MATTGIISKEGLKHPTSVRYGIPVFTFRTILVGPPRHGKSETGNTIFRNSTIFNATTMERTSTTTTHHWNVVHNYPILVCDTPGLSIQPKGRRTHQDSDDIAHVDTSEEIKKALTLTYPGPHVLLYVLSVRDPYTDKVQKYYEAYKQLFGKQVLKHTILVFTGIDELEKCHRVRTIEDYIEGAPESVNAMLADVDHRYVIIDNSLKGLFRESQVRHLLDTINTVVTSNNGAYFANEHRLTKRIITRQGSYDVSPALEETPEETSLDEDSAETSDSDSAESASDEGLEATDARRPTKYNGPLRVVLVGPPRQGKSATGNLIFNKLKKEAIFDSTAKESHPNKDKFVPQYSATIQDRDILVCDTPGLPYHSKGDDEDSDDEDTSEEIRRAIECMASPGPHALLYVLSETRYTKELQDCFEMYKQLFGKEILRYTLPVFRGLDALERSGITLETHIENAPNKLKEMIEECGGRYIGVNNRAEGGLVESQIVNILQKVNELVTSNKGAYFVHGTKIKAKVRRQGSYDVTVPQMDTSDESSNENSTESASEDIGTSDKLQTDKYNGVQEAERLNATRVEIEHLRMFYQSRLQDLREQEAVAQMQLRENMDELERLSTLYRSNLKRVREQERRARQREAQYEQLISRLKEGNAGRNAFLSPHHWQTRIQHAEVGSSCTMTFTGNPSIDFEKFLRTDFEDLGMDETAKVALRDVGSALNKNETITRISYIKLQDSRIGMSEHSAEMKGVDEGFFTQSSC